MIVSRTTAQCGEQTDLVQRKLVLDGGERGRLGEHGDHGGEIDDTRAGCGGLQDTNI